MDAYLFGTHNQLCTRWVDSHRGQGCPHRAGCLQLSPSNNKWLYQCKAYNIYSRVTADMTATWHALLGYGFFNHCQSGATASSPRDVVLKSANKIRWLPANHSSPCQRKNIASDCRLASQMRRPSFCPACLCAP